MKALDILQAIARGAAVLFAILAIIIACLLVLPTLPVGMITGPAVGLLALAVLLSGSPGSVRGLAISAFILAGLNALVYAAFMSGDQGFFASLFGSANRLAFLLLCGGVFGMSLRGAVREGTVRAMSMGLAGASLALCLWAFYATGVEPGDGPAGIMYILDFMPAVTLVAAAVLARELGMWGQFD